MISIRKIVKVITKKGFTTCFLRSVNDISANIFVFLGHPFHSPKNYQTENVNMLLNLTNNFSRIQRK